MAPYLLFGFLVAGVLHIYVPKRVFSRWFGKGNLKSVVYASLMGIPLPLCSCGVIPTGISLYRDGASRGATVSFLISTPQTGVDSIVVTYSLLGLPFALLRPVIALITGIFGGLAVNQLAEDQSEKHDEPNTRSGNTKKSIVGVFKYAFDEFLGEIADWLVIGLALAGLISVLIPQDFFETSIFSNELLSMLIVLVASVPFYVCATGSVPIAAVLLLKGLNPGAVLVFLMAGPATNIATMTVLSQTMGRKVLITYLLSIIVGAFLFGWLINSVLPASFFTPVFSPEGHHTSDWMYWFEFISVILLMLLILRHYFIRIIYYMKPKNPTSKAAMETVKFQVDGMTCQNCVHKVESALRKLDSVSSSRANLETREVEVRGEYIEMSDIKNSVEEIGYTFKEKEE